MEKSRRRGGGGGGGGGEDDDDDMIMMFKMPVWFTSGFHCHVNKKTIESLE
jgi:hypothetical protein